MPNGQKSRSNVGPRWSKSNFDEDEVVPLMPKKKSCSPQAAVIDESDNEGTAQEAKPGMCDQHVLTRRLQSRQPTGARSVLSWTTRCDCSFVCFDSRI
ncbi:hypothetical protein B0H14DRAFT_3138986 [Mycena olivaceomarginata]|nr:hypothetical protein B0H14DRAFT_3138986 [Mycena olivaceomarginata]